MEIKIGGQLQRQWLPPFRDTDEFIQNGFCHELEKRVIIDGDLAPDWLILSSGEIFLTDPVQSTWVGRHRASVQLILHDDLAESDEQITNSVAILATRSFTIEVLPKLLFLKDKNVKVEYTGIGGSSLTPWFVRPGVRFAYQLPSMHDGTSVQLVHSVDSKHIDQYTTYEYLPDSNQIWIHLSLYWNRIVTEDSINVILSSGTESKTYTIPITIVLYDVFLPPI